MAAPLRLISAALLLALCSPAAFAKKKKGPPPPPPVGWHREELWKMDCYYPPDFAKLEEGDRRKARAVAITEMVKQWGGQREDGVKFSENSVETVENTLLGRPEAIEGVSRQNLDACKAVAAGGSTDAWGEWLRTLSGKLTAGECVAHLDYTMFDYLDIGTGWQRPLPICKGDKVVLIGSSKDKFRVNEKGPWITVAGDPAAPTSTSSEHPCNVEGCTVGILTLRFVSTEGVEVIKPAGARLVFEAPENGEISYRINDTTFFDNVWFKQGSIEDHSSIEISPASGGN